MAAFERVGRVFAARFGYAEDGEDLVTDIFLDRAAAGEDLCGHAVMELAQHGNNRLRRHRLGHAREADYVGEQHRDILPAHGAQRLVALGK